MENTTPQRPGHRKYSHEVCTVWAMLPALGLELTSPPRAELWYLCFPITTTSHHWPDFPSLLCCWGVEVGGHRAAVLPSGHSSSGVLPLPPTMMGHFHKALPCWEREKSSNLCWCLSSTSQDHGSHFSKKTNPQSPPRVCFVHLWWGCSGLPLLPEASMSSGGAATGAAILASPKWLSPARLIDRPHHSSLLSARKVPKACLAGWNPTLQH